MMGPGERPGQARHQDGDLLGKSEQVSRCHSYLTFRGALCCESRWKGLDETPAPGVGDAELNGSWQRGR